MEQAQQLDLIPISEAAKIFGVSVSTLRRWEQQGKLTSRRTLGGSRRYNRAEVERLANDGDTTPGVS